MSNTTSQFEEEKSVAKRKALELLEKCKTRDSNKIPVRIDSKTTIFISQKKYNENYANNRSK